MKKQVYFTIIGIGALLAIIGFIPGGMSGIWGVLIAGITGVIYYFNRRTEAKVQERLASEEDSFSGSAGGRSAAAKPAVPADEEPKEESSPGEDTPDKDSK